MILSSHDIKFPAFCSSEQTEQERSGVIVSDNDRRGNLPRWATATGTWTLVALITIIGWGLKEYKAQLDADRYETRQILNNTKESLSSLDKRLSILENQLF